MEAAITSFSLSLIVVCVYPLFVSAPVSLYLGVMCWFGIVALPGHLYLFQPKGCCLRG